MFLAKALEHLTSFTLAFPGAVVAVAMLLAYLELPVPVYGTTWILVLGYITRYEHMDKALDLVHLKEFG